MCWHNNLKTLLSGHVLCNITSDAKQACESPDSNAPARQ